MLILSISLLIGIVPVLFYFWRQYKIATPSLQWPILAQILNMDYLDHPPRLQGVWEGRSFLVEEKGEGFVLVSLKCLRPSTLRIEVGPKELVEKRAGILVPDPVDTGDGNFSERFLVRANNKAAGLALFDPALRQRLMDQANVDIIAEKSTITWSIAQMNEPNQLEALLDLMTPFATQLEKEGHA